MKQINPNIYPHGGYSFKDEDGSKHVADSWAGVEKRVAAYRKRQGKPFDRVHEEVIAQACSRTPVLCVEDNGVTQAKQREVSLKTRVLTWLGRLRGENEGLRYVDAGMHAARTDVCIRCPRDKSLPEGCSSCRSALNALREEIVGKRGTDSRIVACPVLGEYLPVSTWLDSQAVDNSGFPAECWRKRTI